MLSTKKVTIQFAIDDWWISDHNSYIYQMPATQFVNALEDSVTPQIDYHAEQELKASSHQLETLFRMMAEKSAAFYARRIVANLTLHAAECYNDFLEKYPEVVQRVPSSAEFGTRSSPPFQVELSPDDMARDLHPWSALLTSDSRFLASDSWSLLLSSSRGNVSVEPEHIPRVIPPLQLLQPLPIPRRVSRTNTLLISINLQEIYKGLPGKIRRHRFQQS